MNNETQDPKAPGQGAGAPQPDATNHGATAQRAVAAAKYGQHAGEPIEPAEPAEPAAPAPVQALEADIAALKDQLLRAHAEIDNIRTVLMDEALVCLRERSAGKVIRAFFETARDVAAAT